MIKETREKVKREKEWERERDREEFIEKIMEDLKLIYYIKLKILNILMYLN